MFALLISSVVNLLFAFSQDPELHHPMVQVDRAAPTFTFQNSSSLFVKVSSCRASPLFISSATCVRQLSSVHYRNLLDFFCPAMFYLQKISVLLWGPGTVNMKFLLLVWRRPDQAVCSRHPHQGHPHCSASQPGPTTSQPALGRSPGIPAPLSNTRPLSLLTIPFWPSQRACIQPLQHSSCVSVIYPLLEDF